LFGVGASLFVVFFTIFLVTRDIEAVIKFLVTSLRRGGIVLTGFKTGGLYFGTLLYAILLAFIIAAIIHYGNKKKKIQRDSLYRIEQGKLRTRAGEQILGPIAAALVITLFSKKVTSSLIESTYIEGYLIVKIVRMRYLFKRVWLN
jgi:hypothetical protein